MKNKTVQIAIIALISLGIIYLGYSYFSKGDVGQDESYVDGISSSQFDSSSIAGDSSKTNEVVAEPDKQPIAKNKAVLQNLNTFSLNDLKSSQVNWGPGTEVDERNRNIDCIGFQEKYGQFGAQFIMDDDKIYLTFDLGYEPGYTNDILDVLKEKNVQGTFFITSTYVKGNEAIVQRMIDEGHTIGGHTITHPNMTRVNDEKAVKELNGVNEVLSEQFGITTDVFRFPEGAFSEKALAIASNEGYHSIFWSFAYRDWEVNNQPSYETGITKATKRLHPGAIYLLHPMKTNSKILGELIDTAKSQGYEFGVF